MMRRERIPRPELAPPRGELLRAERCATTVDRARCAVRARPEDGCALAPDMRCPRCEGPEAFIRDDGACELCAGVAREALLYALERVTRDAELAPWCDACRKVLSPGEPRRVLWGMHPVWPGGVIVRCEACAARGLR